MMERLIFLCLTLTLWPVLFAGCGQTITATEPVGVVGGRPTRVTIPSDTLPTPTLSPPSPLPLQTILYQPGDLPQNYRLDWFSSGISESRFPRPDEAGSLFFQYDKKPLGFGQRVEAFFYNDPSRRNEGYRQMLETEAFVRPGIPQPAPGQAAMLFQPIREWLPRVFIFQHCRAVVMIRLATDQHTLLTYAERIAQRIEAVDCGGAREVPVFPPPVSAPTTTPLPPAPVVEVVSHTVRLLPLSQTTPLTEPLPLPAGPLVFFSDGRGIGAECNGNGTICYTTDAGRSWSYAGHIGATCRDGFVPSVSSMSFPDPTHGWATISCRYQPLPLLYHTSDGGKTWSIVTHRSNEHFRHVDDGYVAVSFVNRQTGYLVTRSGVLLRTDDGGETMRPLDGRRAHTATIGFATAEVGWQVRGEDLFATSDGGYTWEKLPLAFPVQQFALRPGGTAWVIAGPTAYGGNPDPERRLFATRDGGETWREYRLDVAVVHWQPHWIESVHLASGRHGWLRRGSVLLHTADSGRSWFQMSAPSD